MISFKFHFFYFACWNYYYTSWLFYFIHITSFAYQFYVCHYHMVTWMWTLFMIVFDLKLDRCLSYKRLSYLHDHAMASIINVLPFTMIYWLIAPIITKVLYLEHTWIHVSLKYNSFYFPCSIFIFTKPVRQVSSLHTTTLNVPFNIYAVHTLKNIKALRYFVVSLSPILSLRCLYRWTTKSHKQSCFNLYFC